MFCSGLHNLQISICTILVTETVALATKPKEYKMTNTYEIRSFNLDGNCYSVKTYSSKKVALNIFDKNVCNTVSCATALKAKDLPTNILAQNIQLVARNESMTWLEEIKIWKAT